MELILLVVWIVCWLAAATIASEKGQSGCLWSFLGFLLGPLALLLAATLPKPPPPPPVVRPGDLRKCPQCAEMIKSEAIKCRFCGSEIEPVSTWR